MKNVKYDFQQLLSIKDDNKYTAAMSPMTAATHYCKECDVPFNRLARLRIDDDEHTYYQQFERGEGWTGYDHLITGAVSRDSAILVFLLDTGLGTYFAGGLQRYKDGSYHFIEATGLPSQDVWHKFRTLPNEQLEAILKDAMKLMYMGPLEPQKKVKTYPSSLLPEYSKITEDMINEWVSINRNNEHFRFNKPERIRLQARQSLNILFARVDQRYNRNANGEMIQGDAVYCDQGQLRSVFASVMGYDEKVPVTIGYDNGVVSYHYIGEGGYGSISGSPDLNFPAINRGDLILVPSDQHTVKANAWIFYDGRSGAHKGVTFPVPVGCWVHKSKMDEFMNKYGIKVEA